MRKRRYRAWLTRVAAASLVAATCLVGGHGLPAHAVMAITTRLDLLVSDIVYDPGRDVIYTTVDPEDENHPNQVVTIDPDTHEVVAGTSFGTEPGALALSPDGERLYVGIDGQGTVKRIDLPGFTQAWSMVLGSYNGNTMLAGDIAVMPGTDDTIAVSRRVEFVSPDHAGVSDRRRWCRTAHHHAGSHRQRVDRGSAPPATSCTAPVQSSTATTSRPTGSTSARPRRSVAERITRTTTASSSTRTVRSSTFGARHRCCPTRSTWAARRLPSTRAATSPTTPRRRRDGRPPCRRR